MQQRGNLLEPGFIDPRLNNGRKKKTCSSRDLWKRILVFVYQRAGGRFKPTRRAIRGLSGQQKKYAIGTACEADSCFCLTTAPGNASNQPDARLEVSPDSMGHATRHNTLQRKGETAYDLKNPFCLQGSHLAVPSGLTPTSAVRLTKANLTPRF